MVRRKEIRTRGKIQLSKYFQEFEEGAPVGIVKEKSIPNPLPKRMQGRTGIVESKKGRAYVVLMKDQNKDKRFIVNPIHLRRVK